MWGDLGKLIVAKGFKKIPKVQLITQSGHNGYKLHYLQHALVIYHNKACLPTTYTINIDIPTYWAKVFIDS